MNQESFESIMQRIVLRCWTDAEFKTRLLADPVAVLQAEGLSVPSGRQLRVVEDTPQCVHWVLPARPVDLSDDELDQVAGGKTFSISHNPKVLGSYSLVLAKSIGTHNQASVVWVSTHPFNQATVDWTTSYSVYTR